MAGKVCAPRQSVRTAAGFFLIEVPIVFSGVPLVAAKVTDADAGNAIVPLLAAAVALSIILVLGLSVSFYMLVIKPRKVLRRNAEEEARLSAAHVHYSLKYTNDFIALFNQDFRLLEANERMIDFYGYSREELIGMHASLLRGPEAKKDLIGQVQLVQASGHTLYETVHQTKDGKVFPVEVSLRAIDYQGGRYYQAVIRDITERREAQRELRESERELRALFEQAPLGVAIIDATTGQFRKVNQQYCTITGYSEPEMLALTFQQITHSDDLKEDLDNMDRLRGGEVRKFQMDKRYIRKDGSLVWVRLTCVPLWEVKGTGLFHIAMVEDITARKQAEARLAENERKYRELVEYANSIILRWTRDGRISFLNEFGQRFFGYTAEEVIGRHVMDTIVPKADSDQRDMRQLMEAICADPEAFVQNVNENMRRSGERVWIAWTNRVVHDEQGGVIEILSVGTDITELKHAEEALYQSKVELQRLKNYLANIIDSMPSILVGLDSDGRVVQWSSQAQKAAGVSAAEALGKPVTALLSEFSSWIQSLQKDLKENRPASHEKVLILRNGQRLFFDLMLYPLMTGGEKGAVLRIDDATERARIQELMVQTEKMMSLGGLAAGMAHEINNPLGIITQAAQNIERRVSPELPVNRETAERFGVTIDVISRYFEERKIGQFIGDIREATLRAARIIANMLQFSRQSNVVKQHVSLGELLDRTTELAASDYDLKKNYDFRSIEVVKEYDPGLPVVPVVVVEIEQVILNLLKNSGQALISNPPERKARITLRTRREGHYAVIEVEDNGPGMEESVRRRVFEPFFTTKEPGVGTGLGLSVSYTIITINHKGFISVESAPNQGARFTIQLPIRQEG